MKFNKLLFILLFPLSLSAKQTNYDFSLLNKKIEQQSKVIEQQSKLIAQQKREIRKINSVLKLQKEQQDKWDKQLLVLKNITGGEVRRVEDNLMAFKQSTQQLSEHYKDSQSELSSNLIKINHKLEENQDSILGLDKNINTQWIYGIVSLLFFILILLLIYLLLIKRISRSSQMNVQMLTQTRKALEEEGIKLDNKLVELLENQIKTIEFKSNVSDETNDDNHSLVLKVADEIIRIQKNISNMDSNVKGMKQLSASVKRIQDNFFANGYELVDMIGKDYQEGMNVIANFVTSDELETGVQRITRIIKPQVNYNGVMIQAAQIEVTIGE